jgi:hypothetical protein
MSEAVRTAIGVYAMNATLIVVLFWQLHSRMRDAEDRQRNPQRGPDTSK